MPLLLSTEWATCVICAFIISSAPRTPQAMKKQLLNSKILEQLAEVVFEPDEEAFEDKLSEFIAFIRYAHQKAQAEGNH
jgi:hypothetical protein